MQVKAITVNAAGLTAAGQGIQGNGLLGTNQSQAENSNTFGPECKVMISREGKNLSRHQTAQAETNVRGAQSAKDERTLLRQQEEAERAKEIREGYREKLNEIDKQITAYNTSSRKAEMKKVIYDAALMDETIEEQLKLRTAMQNQKQFQAEENQRKAREAQQMAMQSAQYQDEIDENNRDLLTLLKTMEEAEKAEDEQENGEAGGDGNGASGTGNSAGDVIQNSAAQFMASSVKREWGVENRVADLEETGRWFLDTADTITQNVLRESANIKAALDDEAFSDEQIAEMMQSFQKGMNLNLENVRDFRGFGIKVLQETREDKLKHMADDPLRGMQETKNSMMLSAADAAIGEERQSSLDKTSQELEEEVKELIDERNDVDRIPQDEEDEQEEQLEKAEEEEQAGMQEKLLQPKEQDREAIV